MGTYRLKDIAEIIGGFAFKSEVFTDTGVPVVKIADITGYSVNLFDCSKVSSQHLTGLDRFKLSEGDIVMAMTGATTGKVGRFLGSESAYINQRVARIRVTHPKATQDFLWAIVSQPEFSQVVKDAAAGSAQENISTTGIGDIPIDLPHEDCWRRIGGIMGTIDRRIRNNQSVSSTLEHLAQTLFKSWFVDFDPVVAKSEGRKPFGVSDEIAALFSDSFEESELGAVPKGWSVVDIGHLTDIQNGFAFKSDWWKPQGTPVVKIGSVKPGYVDVADASFLDSQKAAEFRAYELEEGDILIGLTGYPGEVGLVPRSIPKPLLNQRVGRFTPKKAIYRSFVYAMTRRSEFREQVEQRAHGTAQLNVSTSGVLSIKCTIPSEELLEVFHRLMNPMIAKILNCFDETSQLSKARGALLPELLEGRVFEKSRVKEATAA